METAIAIGHSCKMLSAEMEKIVFKSSEYSTHVDGDQSSTNRGKEDHGQSVGSPPDTSASQRMQEKLNETLSTIGKGSREKYTGVQIQRNGSRAPKEYACIIGTEALDVALEAGNRELFSQVCDQCKAVICCRASPLQKANVVKLVRYGFPRHRISPQITLAIGDGANDVGMIRAANLGVGITGYEGRQAALASDFTLPQFRFLERLLLVHGRWNYKRIARFVQYFFYKNFYLGVTLFLYNAFAFFSGQVIYQDFALTLYSVTMTALPVLVVGVLDQDISADSIMKFPQAYHETRTNRAFTIKGSTAWLILAFYQGIISFGATLLAMPQTDAMGADGTPAAMAEVGALLYSIVIVTANLELAITITFWTVLHHIAIWSSIAFWFFFLTVFGIIAPVEFSTTLFHIFNPGLAARPLFWITLVIACAANLAPSFAIRALASLATAISGYATAAAIQKKMPVPRGECGATIVECHNGGSTAYVSPDESCGVAAKSLSIRKCRMGAIQTA